MNAIVVDTVFKRYGRVLTPDGASIEARRDDVFTLLGPNGAGKPQILSLDEPAESRVEFGHRLQGIAAGKPSLKGVFLTVTGRGLREASPGPRKGRRNGK